MLVSGSTATEWAFDSVPVDSLCTANVAASMMKSDSPPGCCRFARKYLLLLGLYQISSPPPIPGNDAMVAPVVSLMIAVLAAGLPLITPTLQPSPICGAGPMVSPCGPVQDANGMDMVRKIFRLSESNTTTAPGEELSPKPLT